MNITEYLVSIGVDRLSAPAAADTIRRESALALRDVVHDVLSGEVFDEIDVDRLATEIARKFHGVMP